MAITNNNDIMALNIKRVLTIKGLSQKDLAERTGITTANISRIIIGKAVPKNDTLCKIADALGVSIHELYDAPDYQVIYCPHCGCAIKIVADNDTDIAHNNAK